jgi:hypothetical protein
VRDDVSVSGKARVRGFKKTIAVIDCYRVDILSFNPSSHIAHEIILQLMLKRCKCASSSSSLHPKAFHPSDASGVSV